MRVFGIVGWKNAGKTSLMERLIAEFTRRGVAVSAVKHVHHEVDLDQPGKDSFRHRAAGAREVVLASAQRLALMVEHRDGGEPSLSAVLSRLVPVDLVLVEGYKRDAHPKIEVFRDAAGQALIQPGDPTIRAVATDSPLGGLGVPVLDLNDTDTVADFILREVGIFRAVPPAHVADRGYDTLIVVDWSARAKPSPARESKDAIWIGTCTETGARATYHRTRKEAEAALTVRLDAEAAAGRRVLACFDFPFGYPAGFAARLTGRSEARAVWQWLAGNLIEGEQNETNRLHVGGRINRLLGGRGPFWGRPMHQDIDDLPFRKDVDHAGLGIAERRQIEMRLSSASTVWQLMGAGSVGSQALTGLPMIHRLQQRAGCSVWPFDPPNGSLVLAEIYPALIGPAVAAEIKAQPHPEEEVIDRWQVTLLARALWRLSQQGRLGALMEVPDIAHEEGWILGAGHKDLLMEALR